MKSLYFATLLLFVGCGPQRPAEVLSPAGEAVIYGEDSRIEVAPNDAMTAQAQATVMIVSTEQKAFPLLGDSYPLCKDERFLDQKLIGFCSGVLISSNKVLTAAHCMERQNRCAESQFVFGLTSSKKTTSTYKCKSVTKIDSKLDYAIVELDRAVTEAKPVQISSRSNLQLNESVTSLSYPLGMALKKDLGEIVRLDLAGNSQYIRVAVDTFEGSSGSPLFDQQGKLIGILTGGAEDFLEDDIYRVQTEGGCLSIHRCTGNSCQGEIFLRSSSIPL